MLRTAAILITSLIAVVLTAPVSAGTISQATDFSAQKKGGAAPYKASGAPKIQRSVTVNRNVTRTVTTRTVTTKKNLNVNTNLRHVSGPTGGKKILSGPVVSGPKGVSPAKFQLGPGKVGPVAKPANFQFVKLGNKVAPVWKGGPKKIWWGGGWKTFVPFAALGAVVIGGAYYYPDAYLTAARPYCSGVTPEGCRLNWQRIDFEDGGGEWQCVQFVRGRAPVRRRARWRWLRHRRWRRAIARSRSSRSLASAAPTQLPTTSSRTSPRRDGRTR